MQEQTLQGGGELRPQARTNDLVIRELPDEVLIYHLKTYQAFCLNNTAGAVWRQCDGQKTIAEITALLQEEIGAPINDATVNWALHQLSKAKLLEHNDDWVAMKPQLSRREILRQLGKTAVLPLVTTVVAPLAVQAQTCGNANNNNNLNAVGCPCQSNNDCNNDCCGFGNICASFGSVPLGNRCRVNCECAAGTCKGSPQTCQL